MTRVPFGRLAGGPWVLPASGRSCRARGALRLPPGAAGHGSGDPGRRSVPPPSSPHRAWGRGLTPVSVRREALVGPRIRERGEAFGQENGGGGDQPVVDIREKFSAPCTAQGREAVGAGRHALEAGTVSLDDPPGRCEKTRGRGGCPAGQDQGPAIPGRGGCADCRQRGRRADGKERRPRQARSDERQAFGRISALPPRWGGAAAPPMLRPGPASRGPGPSAGRDTGRRHSTDARQRAPTGPGAVSRCAPSLCGALFLQDVHRATNALADRSRPGNRARIQGTSPFN